MTTSPHVDPIPLFPASLKALPHWCVWRPEPNGKGKLTKIPYRPLPDGNLGRAASNDRATWSPFSLACGVVAARADVSLGIFADGDHTFIDLDDCISLDGTIAPWARAVLLRVGSYAEESPSGTGLHIFAKGAVSKASKIDGCEIYSVGRYFTVTGKHVPNDAESVCR